MQSQHRNIWKSRLRRNFHKNRVKIIFANQNFAIFRLLFFSYFFNLRFLKVSKKYFFLLFWIFLQNNNTWEKKEKKSPFFHFYFSIFFQFWRNLEHGEWLIYCSVAPEDSFRKFDAVFLDLLIIAEIYLKISLNCLIGKNNSENLVIFKVVLTWTYWNSEIIFLSFLQL